MARLRSTVLSILLLALGVALPAAAQAAPLDPNGFHFLSSNLFVEENAGQAVITVARADTRQAAQIRYITIGLTAQAPYDYTPVKSMLTFAAGQSTASFSVPIVDHGISGLPKTISVSLFGPSPIGLGNPSTAILTIQNDDPLPAVDPANPLGLATAAAGGNPLAGAAFYLDPTDMAAKAARGHPLIRVIAQQPNVARFGSFSYPNATVSVARYLGRAQATQPGTVPMLTTYRVVDGHCGHWADPPRDVASYERFIDGLAAGIGTYRAVMFLEQDALITTPCLSAHGLAVRMQELNYAVDTLKAHCPRLVVYLDAGAADALPAARAARLLNRAGVRKIQGFFLDATHFDWTRKEIRYGERISRMTGGAHFVVSTGESGRGPLVPKDRVHHGNEVLCNPPGRGLGPKPTTTTGFPNVDAFAWLDNPGGSSGACRPGAPPTGVYWPAYAEMLVRNADYRVR
jgi:endoglucanase